MITQGATKAASIFAHTLQHFSLRKAGALSKLFFFYLFSSKNTINVLGLNVSAPTKNILVIRILDNMFEYDHYFHSVKKDNMKVIFDIGSNIGTSTLYFKMRSPNARIYAFDPVGEVNRYYMKNIQDNGLKNIKKFDVALGNKDSSATIYIEPKRLNMSSLDPKFKGYRKEEVPLRKLSEIIKAERISRIDILKIDVEGAEKGILQDMMRSKDIQKVKYILVEIREDNYRLIEELNKYFDPVKIEKEMNPYDKKIYRQYFGRRK